MWACCAKRLHRSTANCGKRPFMEGFGRERKDGFNKVNRTTDGSRCYPYLLAGRVVYANRSMW